MKLGLPIIPLFLLAGVASAEAGRPWERMTTAKKLAVLDTISKECKVRREWFVMRSANELHLEPGKGAKASQVDCALQHLKPYSPFMGFVGNEAYDPRAQ